MATRSDVQIVRCHRCGQANRVARARTGAICGRCRSPISLQQRPVVITDANFASEVESSSIPVLLDFWAAWCGPCRMVAPIVDQLASELAGQVRVGKLDVDANQRTAARFRVQSIPSMLIFKGGREVDRLVGAQSKQAILHRLQPHI